MNQESDVEELASFGRLKFADLMNDPEFQSFLRRYRDIVDCSRGPSILGNGSALAKNGLSSGVLGLKAGGYCPMSGGITRCRKGLPRQMDQKVCMCAGIPPRSPEECGDGSG